MTNTAHLFFFPAICYWRSCREAN